MTFKFGADSQILDFFWKCVRPKTPLKMSGGFFFEHVVEYFLPKNGAEKKKKKIKSVDHPATEVPMKK